MEGLIMTAKTQRNRRQVIPMIIVKKHALRVLLPSKVVVINLEDQSVQTLDRESKVKA
jgi:hypothetical protein